MSKRHSEVDEFDFGFSFTDDPEEKVNTLKQETQNDKERIASLEEAILQLHTSITPFLNNLQKNPEKTTIHWPNRVEKIEEFKTKLDQIIKKVGL